MKPTQMQVLESLVHTMNAISGSPEHPYVDGKAQVGNYHLSGAYGGWTVHRMMNESGGCTDVFNTYSPKKLLIMQINVWLAGYRAATDDHVKKWCNTLK